jgi:hypothetical protein
MVSKRDCPDGFNQRVVANKTSRETWVASNVNANRLERNVSSPTKRQFTVHLKKNCLVNSNARERYPCGLCSVNGNDSRTCVCQCEAMEKAISGTYLNQDDQRSMTNCITRTDCLQKHNPDRWQRKQQTHLDSQANRIDHRTCNPPSLLIAIDCQKEEKDGIRLDKMSMGNTYGGICISSSSAIIASKTLMVGRNEPLHYGSMP